MAGDVILSSLKEDDPLHCLIICLFNTQNSFQSQQQHFELNQGFEILLEFEKSKYPIKKGFWAESVLTKLLNWQSNGLNIISFASLVTLNKAFWLHGNVFCTFIVHLLCRHYALCSSGNKRYGHEVIV